MYVNTRIFQCVVVAACCVLNEATTIFNNAIDSPFTSALRSPYSPLGFASSLGFRQSLNSINSVNSMRPTFSSFGPLSGAGLKRRCPICDPSVYEYCDDKLFHDSCCCNDPNNPYDRLPFQCQYADCSFLHANSCREHQLITACCCTGYYRK